jgi:hypothetical protein
LKSIFGASLILLGCDTSTAPETLNVSLSVQGRVVSMESGSGIPSATVRLGIGGHFRLPEVVDSTIADASGNFALAREVQHIKGECGYWVGASSTGYESSDPAFSVEFLECRSGVQTVLVRLQPKP